MDIYQLLPQDVFDAAIGANSPSATNLFVTDADLTAASGLANTLAINDETGANNIVLDPGTGIAPYPPTQGAIVMKDLGLPNGTTRTSTVFYVENPIYNSTNITVSHGDPLGSEGNITVQGSSSATLKAAVGGSISANSTGVSVGGGIFTMVASNGFQLQDGANEIIFTATPTSNGLTQTFQDASGVIALTSDIPSSLPTTSPLSVVLANGDTTGGNNIILSGTDQLQIGTAAGNTLRSFSGIRLSALSVNQNLILEADGNVTVDANVNLFLQCGGGTFSFSTFAHTFTDSANSKGIVYAGDYEANFTARSLVTKQYVDAQVGANNELSEVLANGDTANAGQNINLVNSGGLGYLDINNANAGPGGTSSLRLSSNGNTATIETTGIAGGGQDILITTGNLGDKVILESPGIGGIGGWVARAAFDTTFQVNSTTVARLIQFQDADGTVPVGPGWDTLIANPTVTEDGYVIKWNNTNNEYELAPDASGGGETLAQTLLLGNTTGGTNINLQTDQLQFNGGDAYMVWDDNIADYVGMISDGDGFLFGDSVGVPLGIGVELAGSGGVIMRTVNPFITWEPFGGSFSSVLKTATLTASRNIDLPDRSGTLAINSTEVYTNATNVTTARGGFDADITTIDELADNLGTLIADLKTVGILS